MTELKYLIFVLLMPRQTKQDLNKVVVSQHLFDTIDDLVLQLDIKQKNLYNQHNLCQRAPLSQDNYEGDEYGASLLLNIEQQLTFLRQLYNASCHGGASSIQYPNCNDRSMANMLICQDKPNFNGGEQITEYDGNYFRPSSRGNSYNNLNGDESAQSLPNPALSGQANIPQPPIIYSPAAYNRIPTDLNANGNDMQLIKNWKYQINPKDQYPPQFNGIRPLPLLPLPLRTLGKPIALIKNNNRKNLDMRTENILRYDQIEKASPYGPELLTQVQNLLQHNDRQLQQYLNKSMNIILKNVPKKRDDEAKPNTITQNAELNSLTQMLNELTNSLHEKKNR